MKVAQVWVALTNQDFEKLQKDGVLKVTGYGSRFWLHLNNPYPEKAEEKKA